MITARAFLADAKRDFFTALERPLPRYLLALMFFLIALALRMAIFPVDAGYPFFTFYPAVIITALLCRTGPALMVLVLSSLVIDLILIPPAWIWSLTYEAFASISVYVVSGFLICLLIHRSRKDEVQRALLAAIVRSADVAIISKTLQGTITSWNPEAEKLFGYSCKEAIGMPMTMLFPPDRVHEEENLLSQVGSGKNVRAFETVRIRKDGSALDVSVTLSPIRDRFGRIIGASKIAHDITERKALEDGLRLSNRNLSAAMVELQQRNQELDEFAFIASHDLKEPLRGIHNYVSFLEEDYSQCIDEEGQRYLARMKHLAQRMTALIEGLLAYSRLGNSPLPMEIVDMNALLDGVASDLEPILTAQSVEFRRNGLLPSAVGNALRLGEVFQNLIANAIKYNEKPEKLVEVGCKDNGITTTYYVRDNGIGIPTHHSERIFRIFKRLHEQDKFGGGTGIGLTIVRKIVQLHGGQIWLESVEGKGTTFYFTLTKDRL